MLRTIIAGTAVVGGALTFGAAGVAGAATPVTARRRGAAITPSTTVRQLLAQLQARVQKLESKVSAAVPKARGPRGQGEGRRPHQARRRHRQADHQGAGPRDQGRTRGWPRPQARVRHGRGSGTSAG